MKRLTITFDIHTADLPIEVRQRIAAIPYLVELERAAQSQRTRYEVTEPSVCGEVQADVQKAIAGWEESQAIGDEQRAARLPIEQPKATFGEVIMNDGFVATVLRRYVTTVAGEQINMLAVVTDKGERRSVAEKLTTPL